MRRLHEKTGAEIPANLATLEQRSVLHRDVIGKAEILDYVMQSVSRV